ncbi:MAG TPA: chorismate synthase [Syntrophorhabdaceae bacterium]|nr:chorismate synthase [Syntrophorhabdaceae bacterium]HPP42672.1 chorismate synthase [Syntrophorhabdaceae bacterium]
MNSFGRMFRISIFGESHGDCVGVIIDGCPSGVSISVNDFIEDLERRRPGKKGTTSRIEDDMPVIKSGVFNDRTTGAPITIVFNNLHGEPRDYEDIRYKPRPGHADFTAWKKYGGFNDYRGGGHFSGRLTLGIVAAGVIAKKIIEPVEVRAEIVEIGGSKDIDHAVEHISEIGDSVGGIVECRVYNLPAGLGEPFFDSFESVLSHGVFSIPGVKAIEFGCGFLCAAMKGSEYNDEILDLTGKTKTNNTGGINGGITNGNEIYFRIAVRPTSSIPKPQKTIDLRNGDPTEITIKGRHDLAIVLRIPVIVEAISAIVTADFMLLEQKIQRVSR